MNILQELVNWYNSRQVESTIEIIIALAVIMRKHFVKFNAFWAYYKNFYNKR